MTDFQHIKCKMLNRGRGIEWWCQKFYRNFINSRFCACAVKMLLQIAVHATKCLILEILYGKSTSMRTTVVKTIRAPLTDHVILHMR